MQWYIHLKFTWWPTCSYISKFIYVHSIHMIYTLHYLYYTFILYTWDDKNYTSNRKSIISSSIPLNWCHKMNCNDNRFGASTRFTSTSTSTSTCNMCEYEYEYLIITWVRVRVLVDEYEYKYEYRSMINILYRQQIFVVRSLTRESPDS